jgi:hypothetical protein
MSEGSRNDKQPNEALETLEVARYWHEKEERCADDASVCNSCIAFDRLETIIRSSR